MSKLLDSAPSENPWWDTDPRKAKKEKPELESKVEQRFLRICKKRGWKHRKLNGTGARSWQDQLVIAPGVICLIEFKRPGGLGKLSEGQKIHDEECRALGIGGKILITDSAEEAVCFVERLVVTALPPIMRKKK